MASSAVMLPAIVIEIPLATLDAGPMGWSDVPLWVVLIGYVLLIGGIAITTWTQAVNPFFEPGVRIQKDRAQWALPPAALAIALLVVRTHWEDRLLHAELSGYAEYAHRTRYRLLPGLW